MPVAPAVGRHERAVQICAQPLPLGAQPLSLGASAPTLVGRVPEGKTSGNASKHGACRPYRGGSTHTTSSRLVHLVRLRFRGCTAARATGHARASARAAALTAAAATALTSSWWHRTRRGRCLPQSTWRCLEAQQAWRRWQRQPWPSSATATASAAAAAAAAAATAAAATRGGQREGRNRGRCCSKWAGRGAVPAPPEAGRLRWQGLSVGCVQAPPQGGGLCGSRG